jgi:cysteine synthase
MGTATPTKLELKDGVFEGPTAIRAFLNPENNPPIPLVELPRALNPFLDYDVRIFGKLMYLLPLLSVKSLPALNMLTEAEASGRLQDVHTVVENSSGNTAFSLAVIARFFNIRNVIALVPWDIAPGKLDLLRICGAEPRLTKDGPHELSGIAQARDMGLDPGIFNPAQYDNESNPAAYEKWVAPELWKQTKSKLTVFVSGMGTTGTLVGVSRYFHEHANGVKTVGVICSEGQAVPGVRAEARLREIRFNWREAADCVVEVGTKESFKWSVALCQNGLMAGPSSGFALAGLFRFLRASLESKGLDQLRNKDGEVIATFVCGDTPLPYLDKYSTHLDPSDFFTDVSVDI